MARFWIGLLVIGFLDRTWGEFQVIDISYGSNQKCHVSVNFDINDVDCDRRNFFVTHGWLESVDVVSYPMLMRKLISQNHNVFFVNWPEIAMNPIYPLISVDFVGKCFGEYIRQSLYRKCGSPYVHFVGHSLGAHVVGNAARFLQKWDIRVDVITALDPAGPGFYIIKRKSRLSPKDANFVVQLVTNQLLYGTSLRLGHVIFYANSGFFQPGCPFDDDPTTKPIFCSHQRSVSYTIEAVDSNQFVAVRCGKDANELNSLVYNLDVPTFARGSYCFKTSDRHPYALGYGGF